MDGGNWVENRHSAARPVLPSKIEKQFRDSGHRLPAKMKSSKGADLQRVRHLSIEETAFTLVDVTLQCVDRSFRDR